MTRLELYELGLYVFVLVTLLMAVSVLGAEDRYYWKSCSIVNNSLSACGPGGEGSESEMLKAEKAARKQGELFLREYVPSGGEPVLSWPGSRLWIRGSNAKIP